MSESKERAVIQRKIVKDQKKIEKDLAPPSIPLPGKVESYDKYYPMLVKRTPDWLQKEVHFRGKAPLDTIVKQSVQGTPIIPIFSGGADPKKIVKIHIDGTVNDLIQQLSEQSGYHFETGDNSLVISDIVTRTFHIDAVPGQMEFDVGTSKDQYEIGSIISSDSENGGSNASQISKEKGEVSVWDDIHEALSHLISADGKLDVSQSASSVTVTDHQRVINAISRWVKNYNLTLGQQVYFKVQVLTVDIDNSRGRNSSFNLNKIFGGSLAPGVELKSNPGSGFSPPEGITDPVDDAQTLTLKAGAGEAFKFALAALSSQGRTTLQQENMVTAINNHTAQLRQASTTAYLSEVKVTHNNSGSGAGSADIEYKPGKITTGFEMYILPHIEGQSVKMRVSMSLANLTRMDQKSIFGGSNSNEPIQLPPPPYCTAGQKPSEDKCNCPPGMSDVADACVSTPTPSGSGNDQMKIAFPQIETRKFNQDAVVQNGDTLVMGGFRSNLLWMGADKDFGLSFLGGYKSAQKNTVLVFLITPYIANPQPTDHTDVDE